MKTRQEAKASITASGIINGFIFGADNVYTTLFDPEDVSLAIHIRDIVISKTTKITFSMLA